MNEVSSSNQNNENVKSQIQSDKNALLVLVITSVLFILFDQLTKSWASANLEMCKPVNVFGKYLRFMLVHNEGLIWGLPFKSNLSYYVLPIIGIAVILYIALKSRNRLLGFIYGLIIAGAIGNLIDRIRFGYVVDFIDMGINNLRWPTYNIADLSIVVGIVMFLVYEIFGKRRIKIFNHE